MLVAEISSLLKCCNPFALLSLLNAVMAVRIRLFQSVGKYRFLMGIYVTECNERAPFNYKNFIFLGSVAQLLISSLLFFVFQAVEQSNSFHSTLFNSTKKFFHRIFFLCCIFLCLSFQMRPNGTSTMPN